MNLLNPFDIDHSETFTAHHGTRNRLLCRAEDTTWGLKTYDLVVEALNWASKRFPLGKRPPSTSPRAWRMVPGVRLSNRSRPMRIWCTKCSSWILSLNWSWHCKPPKRALSSTATLYNRDLDGVDFVMYKGGWGLGYMSMYVCVCVYVNIQYINE